MTFENPMFDDDEYEEDKPKTFVGKVKKKIKDLYEKDRLPDGRKIHKESYEDNPYPH